MIKAYREKFNTSFDQKKYEAMVHDLNTTFDIKIDFKIAETPIFLPDEFRDELIKASDEIVSILQTDAFREYSKKALPDNLAVPNEDEHTSLLAIDFALCKDEDGKMIPQLIELQGFASLYCYQELLNMKMREYFNIPDGLTSHFNGLNHQTYINKLKETIIGDTDPENVILLEIEPEKQKTFIDFLCTEKYLGIKYVCLTKIIKEGKKLFYEKDGKKTLIKKIYNRVIHDELAKRKDIKYNFRFTEELDVKWIAHPNWFYKISKFSLPFLKSKYVPDTKFLTDYKEFPADTENYILKPLFSFAGAGVVFDVTKEILESIEDRSNYILQKKIQYEPVIETQDIPAKAEIRLLYVWNDKPMLINNLVRLSKGKMMGVDFNKEKTWVGSSIAYFNNY
ncbi:MAG TPA: hypothetical protein PK536_02530 [Ignavibacteria bacterium]|nr:hypothetical protein [Bacteroidota bacterium]HRI84304.1 hypothetical protein [Ignavibacteria bacterium]HRJ98581.1 hypothetical protein [Ignavibacteria bacterium]